MNKDLQVTTTTSQLDRALKKNSWIFSAIYVFVIAIVAAMLVFSYVSVFTSNFYPKTFKGRYMVGVVDTTNYLNVKKGQLLLVSNYKSSADIKIGDTVFFSGGDIEGTGEVSATSKTYVTVQMSNGTKNVQISNIIGKVTGVKDGVGYIVWFFASYAGVITFNIILILLAILKIVFNYYVEPTRKGQQLLTSLSKQNKQKQRAKHISKLYEQKNQPDYINLLLDGNYAGNKTRMIGFAQEKKDIPAAYKFMLKTMHRKYVVKEKLTAADSRQITNCIELMCSLDAFDMDDEYMLSDLILHCPLTDFDINGFCVSANSYLAKQHTISDLLHFQYVLYLLIKQNNELPLAKFSDIVDTLNDKLQPFSGTLEGENALKLADYIKNLIKI